MIGNRDRRLLAGDRDRADAGRQRRGGKRAIGDDNDALRARAVDAGAEIAAAAAAVEIAVATVGK
jgi:hypothetical protein